MSWKEIIKHRPKDKEGNYITVKQEHVNTITEWLDNNADHEEYDIIKRMFDGMMKVADGDVSKLNQRTNRWYQSMILYNRGGELFNLYR